MTDSKHLGQTGEQLAVRFLRRRGYRIVRTNFRACGGEVDIIAREKGALCFVEVKTRASSDCGSPWEAVSPFKQRRVVRAARAFLATQPRRDWKVRFDVVAVWADGPFFTPRLELLRNAFDTGE